MMDNHGRHGNHGIKRRIKLQRSFRTPDLAAPVTLGNSHYLLFIIHYSLKFQEVYNDKKFKHHPHDGSLFIILFA